MNELQDRLRKEHGVRPHAVDGFPMSQWIVADYGDVVIHLFHTAKRAYYRLEDLWGDAPRLALRASDGAPAKATAAASLVNG